MSTRIHFDDVSIRFNIFGLNGRSLKKAALSIGTGGRVGSDGGKHVHIDALRGITLDLREGDRVGLVGHNGAGKSTLLRAMAGIYEPTSGTVMVEGRVSPMFDLMLGIDPDGTGHENLRLRGLFLGLSRQEIEEYASEIAAFSGLGEYLDLPVRTYSSGMLLRLMFSVATAVSPEILLLDEWITAGDAKFMEKAELRVKSMIERSSLMVIASHSRDLVTKLCNKVAVLEKGEVIDFGPITDSLLNKAMAA